MGLRVPPGQRKARTTSARGSKTTPRSRWCSPKNFKLIAINFFEMMSFLFFLVGTAVVARATESIESKSCDGWLSRNQLKGKFKWDLTSPLILPVCVVFYVTTPPGGFLAALTESQGGFWHTRPLHIFIKAGLNLFIYSFIHSLLIDLKLVRNGRLRLTQMHKVEQLVYYFNWLCLWVSAEQ